MEERLAVATIAADIGIWDLDVRSDSLLWCYHCAKIFGAPLEPGRWKESVFERIHVEDRKRVKSAMAAALHPSGTGVFDSEYRIVRPDGKTRWIASNGKAFFEHVKGKRTAIRFLGTLLDRTEQTAPLSDHGLLSKSSFLETVEELDTASSDEHFCQSSPVTVDRGRPATTASPALFGGRQL